MAEKGEEQRTYGERQMIVDALEGIAFQLKRVADSLEKLTRGPNEVTRMKAIFKVGPNAPGGGNGNVPHTN